MSLSRRESSRRVSDANAPAAAPKRHNRANTQGDNTASFQIAQRDDSDPKLVTLATPPAPGSSILSWPAVQFPVDESTGRWAPLQAGAINLYAYPKLMGVSESNEDKLPPDEQKVLTALIVSLAVDETCGFMETYDSGGANPVLSLLVANTPEALEVVVKIFHRRPSLMPVPHTEAGIFVGEHAIHVLAVNRHEDIIVDLIKLASKALEREELEALFLGQTRGLFFKKSPMFLYGSTLLNYCVAFSLKRAITTIYQCWLETPAMRDIIDPNNNHKSSACQLTGMLPIHVAVVNGLVNMLDFLVDLPALPQCAELRSSRLCHTADGTWTNLDPLGLATVLGDQRMFKHILRRHAMIIWKWGPVTRFHMTLEGIDSAGDSDNDVMELVTRGDTSRDTKQLLDDDFLDGLLHKLFLQKWKSYGRKLWFFTRILSLFYLMNLGDVTFRLKMARPIDWCYNATAMNSSELHAVLVVFNATTDDLDECHPFTRDRTIQTVIMVFVGVILNALVDILGCGTFFHNMSPLEKHKAGRLYDFASSYNVQARWAGYFMTCAVLIVGITLDPDYERLAPYWVFLAIPFMIEFDLSAREALAPLEDLGTKHQLVYQMILNDIIPFLSVYFLFLFNFAIAIYTTMPAYGIEENELNEDGSWNIISAIYDIVVLSFLGVEMNIDVKTTYLTAGSLNTDWDYFNYSVFLFMYLCYVIVSIILLLNLLIATMGDTYASSSAVSKVQFRITLGRRIMFYERIFMAINATNLIYYDLHCGEKGVGPDGKVHYFMPFETTKPNKEGRGQGTGKPIFDPDEVIRDEHEDDDVMNGDFLVAEAPAPAPAEPDPPDSKELIERLQRMVDQLTSMGGSALGSSGAALPPSSVSQCASIESASQVPSRALSQGREARVSNLPQNHPVLTRLSSGSRVRPGIHSGLRSAPTISRMRSNLVEPPDEGGQ